MIDRIKARRDALAAQLDQGRLAYADLEAQRDQAIRALVELQRHLDALAGGVQELDALLEEPATPAFDPFKQTVYEDPSLIVPMNLQNPSLGMPCNDSPPS